MSIHEKNGQEPGEMMAELEEIVERWERESGTDTEVAVFSASPNNNKPQVVTGKTRLEIDFPNPAAMWEWLAAAKGHSLPDDVALYSKDSLDKISDNNTFIVKREGDRPDEFRFVVVTTESRKG